MICGLPYLLYDWFLLVLPGIIYFYRPAPILMGVWEFSHRSIALLFLVLSVREWGLPGWYPGGEKSPGELGGTGMGEGKDIIFANACF